METYRIILPLSKCKIELEKLWDRLKEYQEREMKDVSITPQMMDADIFLMKFFNLTEDVSNILLNLHIGAINSYRFGYHHLVINYCSKQQSHILSFINLTVTFYKNKISCEGILTKNGENLKCEYNFKTLKKKKS